MAARGLLRYERFLIICFNCGLIGHKKSSCTEDVTPITDDGLSYGRWIKADKEQISTVNWISEGEFIAGSSMMGDSGSHEPTVDTALDIPQLKLANPSQPDGSKGPSNPINPIVRSLIQNLEHHISPMGGCLIRTSYSLMAQDYELERWLKSQ